MLTQEARSEGNWLQIAPQISRQTNLLQTKFYVPPSLPHAISRLSLIPQLKVGPATRLILVSAPAGFGKTTLVAEWLAHRQVETSEPCAGWLSLEEADNDLKRFWRYVIAALRSIDQSIGQSLVGTFGRPSLPADENWLAPLLQDMERVARPIILVLDDYHVIHTRAIHQSLNYFLQHLPLTACLVLLTRADPPLPLARLRVQEALIELRAADLRFSPQEVEEYLNGAMGLGLSEEDVNRLERRTEGWPAGVHLAARSTAAYDSAARRHEFIQNFSGSNSHLFNYLIEEVLQQQQPAVRDFLLQTSILSRLSGPLCAAVTGQPVDAANHTLWRLAHDHLFVIPLDAAGHWFRYHPLFAESLEARLHEDNTNLWNEIHRRASRWCAGNGQIEHSINHAMICADFDAAATLIEAVGDKTWSSGDIAAPLRWLDAMPREIVEKRMALRLLYVWILFLHDRWTEATQLWEETGQLLNSRSESPDGACRGRWAAIGGAMGAHRLLPEETIRLTQMALACLSPDDHLWRAVSHINLSLAYQAQGKVDLAAATFESAADQCIAEGNLYLAFAALAHLNEVCFAQGRLYEAQASSERLQELEGMPGGDKLALRANGKIGLGRLAYERNDLLRAERLTTDAIANIWPGGQPRIVLIGRFTLSRVYEIQGNSLAARQQLDLALEMLSRLKLTVEQRVLRAFMARQALHEGRWEDVKCWQETSRLSAQDMPEYPREFEHCVLAEIWIAEGQFAKAEGLLARLRAAAERDGRTGNEITLLLLYALALNGQKRVPEAELAVRRALTLAQPQGYTRTFLDLGAPLMEIMNRPAVRRQAGAYVSQLYRAYEAETAPMGSPSSNGHHANLSPTAEDLTLMEQLTPREWEILTMIARGASNQEIANRLVLSVGTVKGHVNHIFSKLNVHNRTAAVARARDFQLITP